AYAYDTVSVTVNFVNTPPTIALPDDFEFAMNGTLAVDFSAYVDDLDGDQLTLSVSGNDNIDVEINGLLVTFSATPDWYGSESLAFTVSDGYTTDSDTVEVSVYLNFLAVPAITSINQSAGGITLQWNAVPNATAYRIYRSFDPYGEFSDLRATVYTTSFEDNEVHPMAFYKVIAVNEPLTK
ncbi:MAG TPA: Ig-like domain-containing protein, partial [Candidatus Syntrophosphaera sp.]|nr:Ig-like domain-containing protein [Candidatus Syntrophosphaera sp.]